MLKEIQGNIFLSAILFIFLIVPVLYVTNFTYLAADDFCRAGLSFDVYLVNFEIWYQKISGRYFNYFITYLPVYQTFVYRMLLSFLIFLLMGAIYFVVSRLNILYSFSLSYLKRFSITGIIFSTVIAQLPSLYEYFFWYASASVYLLSSILFLFILGYLFNFRKMGICHTLIVSLLIIMLNGNNEMFLILNALILCSLLIRKYYFYKKWNTALIIINVVNLISALFVVFSPASVYRRSFYPAGGNVQDSILNSLLSAGMFMIKKMIDPLTILFTLSILFFLTHRTKGLKGIRPLHPLIAIVITYLAIAVVMVVPYYATGSLNVNQGRIGNMIQFLFILFVTLNIFNLLAYLNKEQIRLFSVYRPKSLIACIIGFLVYITLFNKNYDKMYSDIFRIDLYNYDMAMEERLEYFKNDSNGEIHLNKIKAPASLNHWEVSLQKEDWSYQCYKDYLYRNYEIEMDSLIIDSP